MELNADHIIELLVFVATILLVIPTFGVWIVTAKLNKLTIQEMSHANDNATEVALAAIDSHTIQRAKLAEVRRMRRRMNRVR
jgi:hypothetical protein